MDILSKLKVHKVSKVESGWVIRFLFLALRTFDFTDLIYSFSLYVTHPLIRSRKSGTTPP